VGPVSTCGRELLRGWWRPIGLMVSFMIFSASVRNILDRSSYTHIIHKYLHFLTIVKGTTEDKRVTVLGITLKNILTVVKPMSCVEQCNDFSFNCVRSNLTCCTTLYYIRSLMVHCGTVITVDFHNKRAHSVTLEQYECHMTQWCQNPRTLKGYTAGSFILALNTEGVTHVKPVSTGTSHDSCSAQDSITRQHTVNICYKVCIEPLALVTFLCSCPSDCNTQKFRISVSCREGPGWLSRYMPGYGLDGPGFESRWGARFFAHVLGPTQPPVQWVPGASRG
jgi:hypothetical protein